MNILLLGSGGREHALAWKLSQSKKVEQLYIAPGNAGTRLHGTNLSISIKDFELIKNCIIDLKIEMLIIGPEEPLVNGLVDFLTEIPELNHLLIFGPDKKGAMLEGSKKYSKEFMQKYSIPTAKYKSIRKENMEEGTNFIKYLKPPYVLKADGLAGGKGVIIANTKSEADLALMVMLKGKFGKASETVVIEEFLNGIELSVFVITDGISYKILPSAKDYKRIGEGDTGLNTGGMGAISPVPFADEEFMNKVDEQIVKPTIEGLKKEGINYKGIIFIGLMNVNGNPFVIEYNVRFGDPETEVLIPRIDSDLVELFESVCKQSLNNTEIKVNRKTAATIMLVSGGYPEEYENGKLIDFQDNISNSLIFHAGTKYDGESIFTDGGRVMAITSFGENIAEAVLQSKNIAELIHFDGKYFRKDIGFDLLN